MTHHDLAKLVPTLDQRQFSVLVNAVLELRTPEARANISVVDQLRAGLWEFMIAIGFVTDAQRQEVLRRMQPALAELVPDYADYTRGLRILPVAHLIFAEQRYVCWTGECNWYDMMFNTVLGRLADPPVLKVVCDISALYCRQQSLQTARPR